MMSDLEGMAYYWGWFGVGLVLLVLELVAPLTFFLWLGISSLMTGVAVLIFPGMPWQVQFLLFSILSVVSIVISRQYLMRRQNSSDVPNLNRRAQQYVGREVILSEDIRQGVGKTKIDDTYWNVTGASLKKGTKVKIVSIDGTVFAVEAVVPVMNERSEQ